MKVLLVLAVVSCYVNAIEYTLENCKCGSEYNAEADGNGKVQCVGKMLLMVVPCNIPKAPRCICSETVTAIVADKDGTWCQFSEKGGQKKKWPCENTADWAAYKIEYENYKKTLTE